MVALPDTAVALSDLKASGILGFAVWSGVSDAEVALSRLKQDWKNAGLPKELLPRDTRALDSFKRAVTALEGHKTIDRISRIHVDKVVETTEDCVYQVAFVVRDEEHQEATYPRACKFIFNKYTQMVSDATMGEVPRGDYQPLVDAVVQSYEQGLTRVPGSRIRRLIREYLTCDHDDSRGKVGLGAENISGGNSVYFVKAEHADEILKLRAFVKALPTHGFFNILAVADSKEEREQLREHVLENQKRAMETAIANVRAELSKDGRKQSLRTDKISNMFAEYHAMVRHAESYSHVLESDLGEIHRMGDILKRQLDRLLG